MIRLTFVLAAIWLMPAGSTYGGWWPTVQVKLISSKCVVMPIITAMATISDDKLVNRLFTGVLIRTRVSGV